jgi:hypothetical protein
MSNYLRSLVQDELDNCAQAITDYLRSPMDFADELEHWTGRLNKATKALHELDHALYLTQSEWSTLRLLVEFHEGSEPPVNERDFEVLLAKLKG